MDRTDVSDPRCRRAAPSDATEPTDPSKAAVRSGETERIAAIAALLAPQGGSSVAAAGGAPPAGSDRGAPCSSSEQGVRLGIGDDAAVLAPGPRDLVWTVDVQVERVHFDLAWVALDAVGYRATMAALSDLAAMGARPRGVLASLVLPPSLTDAELERLVSGQKRACERLGTAVIGGNLARGSELSITTTALGSADRVLLRSGARAGDGVWLSGPVGLAAAGLELLRHGAASRGPIGLDAIDLPSRDDRARLRTLAPDDATALALEAWALPQARIAAGLVAARVATAAIDLSDGLACDAGRVVDASSTEGGPICMVFEPESLVCPELRSLAPSVRRGEPLPRSHPRGGVVGSAPQIVRPALDLALHGGEDYALLVTAPPDRSLEGFVRVGVCAVRAPNDPPLLLRWPDGRHEPIPARGWDHFA